MTIPFKPTAGDRAIAHRLNNAITANYNVYQDANRLAEILKMYIKIYPKRTEVLNNEYQNTISKL